MACFRLGGAEVEYHPAACADYTLSGDAEGIYDASLTRLGGELGLSLDRVLYQIKKRAPNAVIVLVGYPMIFETGSACVGTPPSNMTWLNDIAGQLTDEMQDAADRASDSNHTVLFADPQRSLTRFPGHQL